MKRLIFGITLPFKKSAGFTLLETIVALGVILAAIVGPYTLAELGVANASVSKNKLTALNLAQEGIEIVRKMRMDNVLHGTDWVQGVENIPKNGSACFDIYGTYTGMDCTTKYLKFDSSTGIYSYNSGGEPPVKFYRTVVVTNPYNGVAGISNGNQMDVRVTVTWPEKSISKSVSLEEVMYNWK